MKKILFLLAITTGLTYFISCQKDKDNNSPASTTPFEVQLTDAPATTYDSVIIDVQGVEVKNNLGATILLNANPGLYDLLAYANGTDTLIASATIPTATVSQVRLILGPNNYVVVGGVRFDMKTPSAQESGLKLNVHAALQPGVLYTMTLDFDAAKSIVLNGNGTYSLKPVIKVVSAPISGSVRGTVTPALALPASAFAINVNSPDTFGATTNVAGQFLLLGVPAGTYNLIVMPQQPYINDTIYNVNVATGVTTDVGTLNF